MQYPPAADSYSSSDVSANTSVFCKAASRDSLIGPPPSGQKAFQTENQSIAHIQFGKSPELMDRLAPSTTK